MSVVSRGCRLLQQSARLSPGLSLAGREVGAPGGGGRGLFGKAGGATGGKSQSKVLSSPSDGIAHIEGEITAVCHVISRDPSHSADSEA